MCKRLVTSCTERPTKGGQVSANDCCLYLRRRDHRADRTSKVQARARIAPLVGALLKHEEPPMTMTLPEDRRPTNPFPLCPARPVLYQNITRLNVTTLQHYTLHITTLHITTLHIPTLHITTSHITTSHITTLQITSQRSDGRSCAPASARLRAQQRGLRKALTSLGFCKGLGQRRPPQSARRPTEAPARGPPAAAPAAELGWGFAQLLPLPLRCSVV